LKKIAPGVSVVRAQFSVGLLELFRFERYDHAFPRHSHERFTFAVFGAGNGSIRIGGATWQAAEGSILAIAPDQAHSAEPLRGRGWTYRSLYPAPDVVAAAVDGDVVAAPRFDRPVIDDPALGRAIARLHARLETAPASLELEERLLLLIGRLVRRYGAVPTGTLPASPAPGVARARAFLEANADYPIRLADVCLACGMSPFQLIRSFHRALGMPPHAYLTQLRVNRARELLLAGEPPSAAAYRCGFSDQSHLTRTFHRIFGVTPGAYARGSRTAHAGGAGRASP
jgi:AraC-like DNA-binding protein